MVESDLYCTHCMFIRGCCTAFQCNILSKVPFMSEYNNDLFLKKIYDIVPKIASTGYNQFSKLH